jgi:hypothetical protein
MDDGMPSQKTRRIFGSTGVAFATHLFGTLTCATCWAIFGPALALMFGSAGVAALSAMRHLAPLSLAVSAAGLGYSLYQLAKGRDAAKKLPFRLAAGFTALSVVGWVASATYVVVTFVKG